MGWDSLSVRGLDDVDVNSEYSERVHHFPKSVGPPFEIDEVDLVEAEGGEGGVGLSVGLQVLTHLQTSLPVG